ncbi:MAG: tyrosine-type recombinase/integrase [Oscillibacter sp.]|nr:tyrosine-type recombinase/integrase [Oscillibacter sp.]
MLYGATAASPELIAQINPKNIRLMNDFLEYLRSVGKAESTVKAYTSDLYIFFVWVLQNADKSDMEALEDEYERQKITGFNESIVDGYTGFIFKNRYGDPMSAHNVNRAIDRICNEYNEEETILADKEGREPFLIRHFSVHNLRHTFCTRFCENESNIKVIQEIMGHADIETTMNIYAEATEQKKKESFANLEGKIKIS